MVFGTPRIHPQPIMEVEYDAFQVWYFLFEETVFSLQVLVSFMWENLAGHIWKPWHSCSEWSSQLIPGIPTTIETMGVNITTIDWTLRVLIIEIGENPIILMVVEAQGHL